MASFYINDYYKILILTLFFWRFWFFMSWEGKDVVILGGGNFGTRALEFLKEKGSRIVVIDPYPECKALSFLDREVGDVMVLEQLENSEAVFLKGDGVDEALKLLKNGIIPHMFVPAIPVHTTAILVIETLKTVGLEAKPFEEKTKEVASRIPEDLIITMDEKNAIIVSSFMQDPQGCDPNCLPPPNHCRVTKRHKPAHMFDILREALDGQVDFGRILESEQIGSGVGGYYGQDLYQILEDLKKEKRKEFSIGIGTSCTCHGVVNFLKTS